MSAPVRLCPQPAGPPRALLGELPRLTAVEAPSWLGARSGQVRPLVPAGAPAVEAVAAPVVETPEAAPAVDPAQLEAAVAAAKADGERAGIAEGQAKVDAIVERYAAGIARLAEVEAHRASADASSAIELGMVVAQEILGRELAIDRTFLVTALGEALAMAGTDGPMRVRIGPTDLAYLEAVRPDVLTGGLQIIEDESLGIGGCVVESEHRVVDATIDGRLAAIAEAIRGALRPLPGDTAAAEVSA